VGGPVENGYAFSVQRHTSASFSPPGSIVNEITTPGIITSGGAIGSISAQVTPGIYYYRINHANQPTGLTNNWSAMVSSVVQVTVVANTAPTANSQSSVTTLEDTAKVITLTGSDAETCNLTFSIVSGPTNGSLGAITNNACVAGSPNADSASVSYTPNANYNGADSFTFKVNDGTADSAPATVSLEITENLLIRLSPAILSAISEGFGISAPNGWAYAVESSSDLQTWTRLTVLTNTGGILFLTPERRLTFFRAKLNE
jgi:hypothetical protein